MNHEMTTATVTAFYRGAKALIMISWWIEKSFNKCYNNNAVAVKLTTITAAAPPLPSGQRHLDTELLNEMATYEI